MTFFLLSFFMLLANFIFSVGGVCGSSSPTGGIIRSSNYPNSYGNIQLATYTLEAADGKRIRLTFRDYVISPLCDYFSVSNI